LSPVLHNLLTCSCTSVDDASTLYDITDRINCTLRKTCNLSYNNWRLFILNEPKVQLLFVLREGPPFLCKIASIRIRLRKTCSSLSEASLRLFILQRKVGLLMV
jgi:hypothetical protein